MIKYQFLSFPFTVAAVSTSTSERVQTEVLEGEPSYIVTNQDDEWQNGNQCSCKRCEEET